MDVCYHFVNVLKIPIQPYFCVKQGCYFFPFFAEDPVYSSIILSTVPDVPEIWNILVPFLDNVTYFAFLKNFFIIELEMLKISKIRVQ